MPCSRRDCDIAVLTFLKPSSPWLSRGSHDCQGLLVGLSTDKELDSTQDAPHVEHLEIAVADTEHHLDLGAKLFLDLTVSI